MQANCPPPSIFLVGSHTKICNSSGGGRVRSPPSRFPHASSFSFVWGILGPSNRENLYCLLLLQRGGWVMEGPLKTLHFPDASPPPAGDEEEERRRSILPSFLPRHATHRAEEEEEETKSEKEKGEEELGRSRTPYVRTMCQLRGGGASASTSSSQHMTSPSRKSVVIVPFFVIRTLLFIHGSFSY